jgi:long-chain acyl-CoA synthetase
MSYLRGVFGIGVEQSTSTTINWEKDSMDAYLAKPWLKFYPEGVPEEIDIPGMSVPDLFDQMSKQYQNNTALIFYGKKIKYKKLSELVDKFATALSDLGVSKGDTVALYLLNCPQYVISYLGVLKLGAVTTPLSPVYTSKEVKHQLENSEAKTVICEDILYENIENSGVKLDRVILTSIVDYLPTLKKLFMGSKLSKAYRGSSAPTDDQIQENGLLRFLDLIDKYPASPPEVSINPQTDVAALPYTGGTTGLPKAAVLTHSNLVAVQAQGAATTPQFVDGKESVLAFLPFFHIYGQVVLMLNTLTHGNTLILFTTPDLDEILSAMERYQVSAFYGAPAFFEILKDYEKTDRVNWKRLKMIVCGADTLHESTVKDWKRRTGSEITEGYGMTETASTSHLAPFHRPKVGSFGIPVPNVDAAIIDVLGSDPMPVGEVGELVLSGPNIMQGYWKNPRETEAVMIDMAGKKWLRTGDIVSMDEEGYFFFFDRKRDLIKYKGYSVFARHVEEVLNAHPQIKAAGVIGVPDPKVGQNIKAYVVLQGDARGKISEEEITEYCRQNLAHYKVPKIVEFRGELPKTDVGKVSRQELRVEAEEII